MPAHKPSLVDDLAKPPMHNRAKRTCLLIEALDKRDPTEKRAVLNRVADQRWSNKHLETVLAKHGMQVSYSTIRNHRLGQCPCFNKGPVE